MTIGDQIQASQQHAHPCQQATRIHSAGRGDRLLRSVHQRPPKKTIPSTRPAPRPVPASTRSHGFIHRHPPVLPAWLCSSLATQCQALKQPIASPATSSASVQECGPDSCSSSQSPSAAPSSVGTTTDQPISPIMPRPNQTPGAVASRLELARGLAPTVRRGSGLSEASEGILGFAHSCCRLTKRRRNRSPFCHHRAHLLLVHPGSETPAPPPGAQLAEVRSADRPTHGHQHVKPVLTSTPSSMAR
jgi:hypothetical protein